MLIDFINTLKESADTKDILSHYHYLPERAVELIGQPVAAAIRRARQAL
jgi:hypothetical protein